MADDTDDPYDIVQLIHLKQTDNRKYITQTNPVLRTIIDGVCDENCALSLLDGTPHIVRTIWNIVVELFWKRCIKKGSTNWIDDQLNNEHLEDSLPLAFTSLEMLGGQVDFPTPKDIQVNMMPFILAESFEESLLPEYLREYWDEFFERVYWVPSTSIHIKLIPENQLGKIGYLTVHESLVEPGGTQRRPGLHTDCPGKLLICENENKEYICLGRVESEEAKEEVRSLIDSKLGRGYTEKSVLCSHPWGMTWQVEGVELVGGIYMANNVQDSCAVWPCVLEPDTAGYEVIGNLGDIEHLRSMLPGEPEMMEANVLYWVTDRTPHESLPLKSGTYRQYFRFVTSEVSLWFEEHSTKNPHGVVPDPAITKVVKGSKFEDNLSMLFDQKL